MLMDNEEFVNVDSELPATAVLEDKEILEMVKDDREDENGDSVDNSVKTAPPPTLCDHEMRCLQLWDIESNEHATEQDITTVNNLHSHINSLVSLFSKQTTITTFFEKI